MVSICHQATRWNRDHLRMQLDDLAEQLGISATDDWYTKEIPRSRYATKGVEIPLDETKEQLLTTAYEDTSWQPWRLSHQDRKFWENTAIHREFFNWLGETLNYVCIEDWYSVTKNTIISHGGSNLLHYYDNCTVKAIVEIYPEVPWQLWRFGELPTSYWKDASTHRHFLEWLCNHLHLQVPEQVHLLTETHVVEYGGGYMLKYCYGNKLAEAITRNFPEISGKLWLFGSVPAGYWDSMDNQRLYFEWLKQEMKFLTAQDWYKLSSADIINHGGGGLLQCYYNNSPGEALKYVYPEIAWQPWRFDSSPRGIWDSLQTQREFFDWVGKQLNISFTEDWYRVTLDDIVKYGGKKLMDKYNHSLHLALRTVYPSVEWQAWRFSTFPVRLWENLDLQRQFFDLVARQLGITRMIDMYELPVSEIVKYGGAAMLKRLYNNDLKAALKKLYPEVRWHMWREEAVPSYYWDQIEHHREFFDWIAEQMNMEDHSQWYNLSCADLIDYGGGGIFKNYYGGSPSEALKAVYPDTLWLPWRFETCPRGYWDNLDHHRQYFDWLGEQLNISKMEDWYHVTHDVIVEYGGTGLVQSHYGGILSVALKAIYPENTWNFPLVVSKAQVALCEALQKLIPDREIIMNYEDNKLRHSNSQRTIELDIFVPSLSLALEYQGRQHYESVPYFCGSTLKRQQHRDLEKIELCKQHGILLVQIPYWWDGTEDSLAATIRDQCSKQSHVLNVELMGLLNAFAGHAIPSEKPNSIPAVMLKNWDHLPLGSSWWATPQPGGLWSSWNGNNFEVTTTSTKHEVFIWQSNLPRHTRLSGFLRSRKHTLEEWKVILHRKKLFHKDELEFSVVDIGNDQRVYESSLDQLHKLQDAQTELVVPILCKGRHHLLELLDENARIILYSTTRTTYILDGKGEGVDWAVVESINPLTARNLYGKTFAVEVCKHFQQYPIAPGSVVKYKYFGLTSNMAPSSAVITGIHNNLRLSDVVPYHITVGTKRGNAPACVACKRRFADKLELRIQVPALILSGSKLCHSASLTFCLNTNCLTTRLAKKYCVPWFKGVVGLPSALAHQMEFVQSALANCEIQIQSDA